MYVDKANLDVEQACTHDTFQTRMDSVNFDQEGQPFVGGFCLSNFPILIYISPKLPNFSKNNQNYLFWSVEN